MEFAEQHRVFLEPLSPATDVKLYPYPYLVDPGSFDPQVGCGTAAHFSRRSLLRLLGASGLAWLNPMAAALASQEKRSTRSLPAKSVILLWMGGGPSQLETFDPHPGKRIAGGTRAIPTTVRGVQLAEGMDRTAEVMHHVSLVRSVVSLEGDHERAMYQIKTGYRMDPTLVHPAIGAVLCHELPVEGVEIPRYVSILPDRWPGRGGYLGASFDAFQVYDPSGTLPDVNARVGEPRMQRRQKGLETVEASFLKGRIPDLDSKVTFHRAQMKHASRMMTSDQLKAFQVDEETLEDRLAYGDTPFGRGCLAARRLVEAGVRCVEVTLNGWDSHVNNHETHRERVSQMDPAFSALIQDLQRRGLLDHTVVLCGGEFGRTPKINGLEGRDHWPHAFSIALAGGGLAGGRVLGSTDPEGEVREPSDPVAVADIHATIQHLLGVNPELENMTPVGRPMALSQGNILHRLIA